MRIQYRKPERPDLLLLVIAMMVWAGLIIYSPLGPFATDPAGQAGDVIVAYTPDNLWRVDASGEKSSLVWRQEELLLQYTPLATPKVTFPDWPGRGFEELPRRWWELDLSPPTRSIPFSPVPPKPKLAFVIDDGGHRWEAAEGFLELQVPMTFAVLPYLPKTSEHAARAAAAGYEVILHLPMEPHGGIDPGQGAILTGLEEAEIRRRVRAALAEVPQATGVNNHMGSLATEDPGLMAIILDEVHSQGLFFVDSHTSPQTVVPAVAQDLGIPFAQNATFIDNKNDVEYVKGRIMVAADRAEKYGTAVAIGHVKTATLAVLQELIPELQERGIELVYVSELVSRP